MAVNGGICDIARFFLLSADIGNFAGWMGGLVEKINFYFVRHFDSNDNKNLEMKKLKVDCRKSLLAFPFKRGF